jgi:alpha-D-ribose 1-methylphosphonate 5-phosphate C-P lyase
LPGGTTPEKIAKLLLPKAKRVVAGSTDGALDLLRKKKVKAMMADCPYTSVTSFKYQDKGFPHSLHRPSVPITPMQDSSLHKTLFSQSGSDAASSGATGFSSSWAGGCNASCPWPSGSMSA